MPVSQSYYAQPSGKGGSSTARNGPPGVIKNAQPMKTTRTQQNFNQNQNSMSQNNNATTDVNDISQVCWDMKRNGYCPREGRCTWSHDSSLLARAMDADNAAKKMRTCPTVANSNSNTGNSNSVNNNGVTVTTSNGGPGSNSTVNAAVTNTNSSSANLKSALSNDKTKGMAARILQLQAELQALKAGQKKPTINNGTSTKNVTNIVPAKKQVVLDSDQIQNQIPMTIDDGSSAEPGNNYNEISDSDSSDNDTDENGESDQKKLNNQQNLTDAQLMNLMCAERQGDNINDSDNHNRNPFEKDDESGNEDDHDDNDAAPLLMPEGLSATDQNAANSTGKGSNNTSKGVTGKGNLSLGGKSSGNSSVAATAGLNNSTNTSNATLGNSAKNNLRNQPSYSSGGGPSNYSTSASSNNKTYGGPSNSYNSAAAHNTGYGPTATTVASSSTAYINPPTSSSSSSYYAAPVPPPSSAYNTYPPVNPYDTSYGPSTTSSSSGYRTSGAPGHALPSLGSALPGPYSSTTSYGAVTNNYWPPGSGSGQQIRRRRDLGPWTRCGPNGEAPTDMTCWDFKRGTCKRGSSCRWQH